MSESEYRELSEFTLYVNFHFVANAAGENFHCDPNGDPVYYAPTIISSLIGLCNNYFDNPIINQFGNPGQVHDSRLRLKCCVLRAGEAPFTLNATQKQTLETIAASDLPNRGYAKALLALLLDTPFEVALTAPSGATFQAAIPETMLTSAPAYQIYPNPVTDYLTIQYPVFEYSRQSLEVIDLNGRVALTRVLDDSGKLVVIR